MAAKVEFHTGVAEPIGYTCRLMRKVYRRRATLVCVAERASLDVLDRTLWTFDERDFVPHVRYALASAAVRSRTPIWLAEHLPEGGAGRDVIVGFGGREPIAEGAAARLIEVVGADDEDVQRGRVLWRLYQRAGFELIHHPFGGEPAA
jgi:DNA polymerase-3 subunit chi